MRSWPSINTARLEQVRQGVCSLRLRLSQNVPNLSPNAFAKVGDEGTRDVECLVENLRVLLILADLTYTGSRKFRFSSQEPTCPNPTSSPKQLKRPSPNLMKICHCQATKGGEDRSQVVKAAAECVTRSPPLGKEEPSVSLWNRRSEGSVASTWHWLFWVVAKKRRVVAKSALFKIGSCHLMCLLGSVLSKSL